MGTRLDASADDVEEALEAGDLRRPASLDASMAGDDRTLAACIGSEDTAMTAVDEKMAVRWLLGRLPERQRRMVSLRYLDGLTQHEIADRMSLSQAHVQRMLVRSIDQLRVLARRPEHRRQASAQSASIAAFSWGPRASGRQRSTAQNRSRPRLPPPGGRRRQHPPARRRTAKSG